MTQNLLNILDLVQVNPKNPANGMLGLPGTNGPSDLHNSENSGLSFDMIFGNMLASVAPELSAQPNMLGIDPQLQLGTVEQDSNLPGDEQQVLVGINQEQVKKNFLNFNTALKELPSQNISIQNMNIKEILSQQNVELENGKFKVLSQEIVDSKLNLTVENSDGKQIQIKLPLDALQNQNGMSTNGRVQLQNSQSNQDFANLLEKVNINEIEIKTAETKISESNLKPVQITMQAEQNSAVISLKASLQKNQIILSEQKAPAPQSKAAVLDESGIWDEETLVETKSADKVSDAVSFGTAKQMFKSLDRLNPQVNLKDNAPLMGSTNKSDAVNWNIQTDAIETANETKEQIQQVRMQLPEDIKSVLQPNRQAIVIKMNPENLGSSKLSLTMHGDKLHAKLVVSSENAKSLLEGSMSRLVDQLHKAQILVDKIDVTVDENMNHQQQFSRQPQWQRKMSHRNISSETIEQTDVENTIQQPSRASVQQPGFGSVNYLA